MRALGRNFEVEHMLVSPDLAPGRIAGKLMMRNGGADALGHPHGYGTVCPRLRAPC